jgi:putative nucleotidyltransferase with HDIG domain
MDVEKITFAFHEFVDVINQALNFRDPYTYSHSERVAAVAVMIAREMGFAPERLSLLHYASHLHDIGKIGVPDLVLNKPGRLDKREMNIIQTHSAIGHTILKQSEILSPFADFVLHHHERFDGKGYPSGIAGEDIPLESRIIAVADTFDALTSNRPYRKGFPFEFAIDEIRRSRSGQLCPVCVDHFLNIRDRIPAVLEETSRMLCEWKTNVDFLLEEQEHLMGRKAGTERSY